MSARIESARIEATRARIHDQRIRREAPYAPIRTLVIDDDFRVAKVHSAFVERISGFEVAGVAHAAGEAAKLIKSLDPDLLLLDVYLPDANGLELLAQLRAREMLDAAGTPVAGVDVIVITAAQDARAARAALRLGAVHYLIKPFPFDYIPDRFQSVAEYKYLIFGISLIVLMIFRPQGLLGSRQRLLAYGRQAYRRLTGRPDHVDTETPLRPHGTAALKAEAQR